jgi:hypothetical protein
VFGSSDDASSVVGRQFGEAGAAVASASEAGAPSAPAAAAQISSALST